MKAVIVAVVSAMAVTGFFSSWLLGFVALNAVSTTVFTAWTRLSAGFGAIDCGRIGIADDPAPGVACAQAALAAKQPFLLIVERQGYDSRLASAVVRTASGDVHVLAYDSAPCGGLHCLPVMTREKCGAAVELRPSPWRPGAQVAKIAGCDAP